MCAPFHHVAHPPRPTLPFNPCPQVHVRDIMFYLETALNMSRVELHMQPGVDLHVPYRAAERMGRLHGHGDVLFSKIVLQYTKPLGPS